jgi:hypothetical protein
MLVMLVVPSCDQTINYPPPKLTSISPTSIDANSPQFILKIYGNNLVQQTAVNWITPAGAVTLPQVKFITINELDATVPSSLIENPGTVDISVTTPTPGGGTSPSSTQPPVVFTINAVSSPTPTVTSLSPTSLLAGSAATTVTITGSNFVSQSTVAISGANRPTTFVNPTSLIVALTAADLLTPSNLQLTVTNPPPDGGTSIPITFAVKAPIPIISAVAPVSATVGAVATTLSVSGTGFINGITTLTLSGVAVPTSVANGTTVTTVLTPAQLLVGGEVSVVATNSGPGGGQSNAVAFSVNPRPLAGLPVLVDLAANGSQAALGICGGSSDCASGSLGLTTDTVGPSTSSTGAWVAYASVSHNLVLSDTNPGTDVYLRNTCLQTATSATDCTPATTVISTDPNGGPANGSSSEPSLSTASATPGFAAFTSRATNLTTSVGPSNFRQVFWRPLCTSTTTTCAFNDTTFITEQISVAADGLTPGNGDSYNPVVSADGSYVAFASLATNLVSSVNADGVHPQIYVRSTCNGQTATVSCAAVTYLVSTGDDNVTPGNGNSEHPSISSEGLYVSFTSNSTNLGKSAPNPSGLSEVFERSTCSTTISSTTNTCAPVTFLVSTPDGRAAADGTSYQSSISYTTTATSTSGVPYNGRFVAFASTATTLVPGAGPTQQIYVRDTCTGITTSTIITTCTPTTYLVSTATADGTTPGNALSERPSISGAAEFIAFSSLASNFANTTNGVENIFVRNACFAVDVTCTQSLAIASIPQGTNASPSNGASYVPSISSDGQTVSFLSFASNLVPNDTNGLEDIFLGSTSFTTVVVTGAKTPADETASAAAGSNEVADNYVMAR